MRRFGNKKNDGSEVEPVVEETTVEKAMVKEPFFKPDIPSEPLVDKSERVESEEEVINRYNSVVQQVETSVKKKREVEAMVSKPISENIQAAKDALNAVQEIGEKAYDVCDGVLVNIKAFVHDDTVWKKINDHENKVHVEFQKKLILVREELKTVDPIFAWSKGMQEYMKLRHWKSLEMLSFYDELTKKHDL